MYGKYYKIKVTEQTAQNGIQLSDVSDGMFSITGISIALPTPYISVQGTWPPVIQSYYNGYSCNKVHSDMIDTASRVINGTTYCVTDLHEASAGTIHHTFTYVTRAYSGTGTKTTNFTLNYQSCDLSQTDCKTAQANFNLDAIIDTLMNQ